MKKLLLAAAGGAGLLLGAGLGPMTPMLTAPSRHALECAFTASGWDVSKSPREKTGPNSETQNLYLEFLSDSKALLDWPSPDGAHDTRTASVRTTSIDYDIDDGAQVFDIDRQTGVLSGGNRQNDRNEVVKFDGACRAVAPRLPKL
jgi:hypothetical protein